MSKSTNDFSAFDFNDSSDNTDDETPAPFLSRTISNNHNNSNNHKNCGSNGSSGSGNSTKRKNSNTFKKSKSNIKSKKNLSNNNNNNNQSNKSYKNSQNSQKSRCSNQLNNDCNRLTSSTSNSSNFSNKKKDDDGDDYDSNNDDGRTNEILSNQNQRPLQQNQQQKQQKHEQLSEPLNGRRSHNEKNNCNNNFDERVEDSKGDVDGNGLGNNDSHGEGDTNVDGDDGGQDDDDDNDDDDDDDDIDDDVVDNADCVTRESGVERHCLTQNNCNNSNSKAQPTHKHNSDVLLMAALNASTEMNNRRNVDGATTLSRTIQSTTATTTAVTTATTTATAIKAAETTEKISIKVDAITNATSTTVTHSNDFSRNSSPAANSIDSNHHLGACSEDDGDGIGIGIGFDDGVGVDGDGDGRSDGTRNACDGDSQMHNGHSKQITSLLDYGHNSHNNNNMNNNSNNNSNNVCTTKNMQNSMSNNNNNNKNNADCNELRRSSSSTSLSNHSPQTTNHADGPVPGNLNIGMNVSADVCGGDGSGDGDVAVNLDNVVTKSAPEKIGGNSNGGCSTGNMARIDSLSSLCGVGVTGGGAVSASASISSISASNFNVSGERKKYRHQNYSKNIYIGTKNAEKWEHMRTRLHFKNDVEFVVYLLNMAENDTERLANLPSISMSTTPTKGFDGNFKLEPNLSAKEFGVVSNCSSIGGGSGGSGGSGGGGGNSQTGENATDILPTPQAPPIKRKYKKRVQFNDPLNGAVNGKAKNISNLTGKGKKQAMNNKGSGNKNNNNNNVNNNVCPNKVSGNGSEILPEVLDCRIAEKIKSELEEKSVSKDSIPNALCLKKPGAINFSGVSGTGGSIANGDDEEVDDVGNSSIIGESISDGVGVNNNQNSNFRNRIKGNKRGPKSMIPPAPCAVENDDDPFFSDDDDDVEDDDPLDEEALAREMKNEQNFVEEEDELDIALRSQQSCKECSLTHDYKVCPLRTAIGTITDAVDLAEWIERKNLEALAKLKADAQRQAKQLHGDDDEDMDESSQLSELETKPLITFAEASVPAEFELHNVEPNVTGVFARTDVRAFSKLGPLIGQSVQSTDIRESSDMKWIFEICEAGAEKSQFLLCDNPNSSNWLRYIRPASNYDERNVNLVSIESQAFFVTCRELKNGTELLYWSDDCNTMWRKKHWSDKTNCGGCNLKFDHSLYYRTHCSIFHDPSMSLTIRKYHCKVCGEAVLGRDNILKHAAEKHDGTGAHQCQFCNKFFLRLSYLDVHRTYGCAANPNRCQPICDLCGRKFFRPQKLHNHMKRVHSGSRAALQRHAKEVHSRNSTVVSCPRCSKLFQNRSNLKIHMLTHSGVRPFKCSEAECNAAFTTKQCLQFHYKKVHNYTQEQMPKIERSVAYTFDAYSGGMKVDFLEQAPRRRRKSLEDHNSVMSSSLQSDTEFSDDNIFEVIKKSGKSIKDLCRNEPNLSLLSSKISSIFGEKPAPKKRGRKRKDHHLLNDRDNEHDHVEQIRRKQSAQLSLVETFLTTTAQRLTAQQQVQQVVAAAAAVSAMASGASDDPNKLHMMPGLQHQHMALAHQHSISSMVHDDEDEDDDEADDEHSHHPHESVGEQIPHDNNNYRHTTGLNTLRQNLVVSKGSKKWISDDDHHISRDCASVDRCALSAAPLVSSNVNATLTENNTGSCSMNQTADLGLPSFAVPPSASDESNKLIGNNRDFLSRLINSANSNHNHHVGNAREEDENTSFLDVVEPNNNNSNNNGANSSMSQYHHSTNANSINTAGGGSNSAGSNSGATNVSTSMTHNSEHDSVHGTDDQDPINSLTHPQSFMSTFYNNANTRLSNTATGSSSSASMLVEAALNSVGNMIDAENNELKVPTENSINTDSPLSSHVDTGAGRFNTNNTMDNLESELKMMKNLNNFPMQMPPLPMFPNANNNLNSCHISPNNSTPTNPHSQQNNEVDVDAGSTPRPQHMGGGGGSSGGGGATETDGYVSASQHRAPTSPQPISPGRDYGMFNNNNMNNGTPGGPGTGGSAGSAHSTGGSSNNISASSPLPVSMAQVQRRTASTVSSGYPEHELISPASSPSIPRYNFNNDDVMRHKHRVEQELDRRQILSVGHNAISSDEENSIMPQNSSAGQDMRMKFSQPQIDLMYSKYESLANSAVLKYNNQSMDSPTEYRNTNSVAVTANATNDMSDLQGLDMSSRSNLNTTNYHHNFQLPSNTPANLSGIGRYHHHIYDILSEREQNQGNQGQNQQQLQHQQQQQQQQQHHHHHHHNATAQHQQQEHTSQLAMQQHQSAMHGMLTDQMNEQEHDQVATVDLSRTANYVVPSPPQLPYNHPHHDMIRMASLDLTPNTNMTVGNNRSFLSSQMQHQSRESIEHHRLLSTVEQHRILAASNAADQHRLLVDPTAHLLMEQNNRLLGSDQSRLLGETAQNRHMAAARGFGAYHQVASGNYHHSVRPTVLPSANHHASNPSNYHPFPAYY